MICYNCGEVLTNSDYCSRCGADVSIYKRVVRLSNTYYNAGLTKAKNRDLAGAADMLKRSVKLYKHNTDARNLLGLVLFEMGESVQAFSEWVISTNLQPDNNSAERYLRMIQQEKGKVDELNHTIKKFNVALEYAKEGTDDMAIIQLKKVINQNPNFVKAYQVLCLLYMRQGQLERAKKAIRKSLKVDKCNPLSIRYMREINEYLEEERRSNPERGVNRRRSLRGTMVDRPYLSGDDVIVPQHSVKQASSNARGIMSIILGILLGAALVYFVITPARISSMNDTANGLRLDYERKLAVNSSSVDELQKQLDSLKSEKDSLDSKLAQYESSGGNITDNYNHLIDASNFFINNDYENCAKSMEKINKDLDMKSSSFKKLYDFLSGKVSSTVASSNFDAGMSSYGNGSYDDAISYFRKVIDAEADNVEAYYYLAWSYKNKGDDDNAKKYFQKIVDDFPNSDRAASARTQAEDYSDEGYSDNSDYDEDEEDYDNSSEDEDSNEDEE